MRDENKRSGLASQDDFYDDFYDEPDVSLDADPGPPGPQEVNHLQVTLIENSFVCFAHCRRDRKKNPFLPCR